MKNTKAKKLIISSLTLIAGYTLRQLAQKKWENVYDEAPPSSHASGQINWKKIIIWSVIAGPVISTAELAITRYLTFKLDD